MAQTLYSSLLVIALCSLSECIQNQYYYINMWMNWTEAQRYCREKYTDLATVNDMNHMNELMKIVNNNLAEVWIGLRNTGVYKWKWSLGDPVKYMNWLSEPTNSLYNCAVMRNGTWRQQDCNVKSGFICYNDSSKSYIIDTSYKTWREAQSFCRQYHTDLTSVRNQTDHQLIHNIINDPHTSVWIGLFRDLFEWSDNSDSAFRYWDSGEPSFHYGSVSEDCAGFRMNVQGKWNDSPCTFLHTFMCHEETTRQIVRLEVKSGLNVKDPAVMENILQWINQKLKNRGIVKDTTVTWKVQSDGNVFTPKHEHEEKQKDCSSV